MNYSKLPKFTSMSQAKKLTGISYLSGINTSAKIKKGVKIGINTSVLYLSPADTSGYNTCPFATKECKAGCLHTSGRVKMDNKNTITNCRLNRTKLFYENREFFMNWIVAEIKRDYKKSIKNGFEYSVRLNGTSDIDWSLAKIDGKNLFEIFPNIQFYDYTKIPKRFRKLYPNYHLTFSYSGYNWSDAETFLKLGYNIAVIFDVKKGMPLPEKFNGYEIIDGDISDYRPNDKKGTIVGLRFKNIKDKKAQREVINSPFVVPFNSPYTKGVMKVYAK